VGEVARPSRLSEPRFLFDQGLNGVARALRWVYKRQILLVEEEPELGPTALDPAVFAYCRKNDLVWVTKDWSASSQPDKVIALQALGVSAVWIREEAGRSQMRRGELLWVAARDLDRIIQIVEASGGQPVYIEARLGKKADAIKLPTKRRRVPIAGTKPRRMRRPRRRRTQAGDQKLFDD
jgi:hypothetical protein